MKICTIIGARPQFIKAAVVSKSIREYNKTADEAKIINEVIIHTGQHYDYEMSQVFFNQLEIPKPDYHLGVGSGRHGEQTGKMLLGIEEIMMKERPERVLVYGDTNSTLAGALAASKLNIPVGHVEGGMRSFNRRMPEEINRVLTDHISRWHFCATETAVKNLKNEGIKDGIYLVGDVMYEAILKYKNIAKEKSDILRRLDFTPLSFALCTVHRAENTDDPNRLCNILEAILEISKDMKVVLPIHPRTKKAIDSLSSLNFDRCPSIQIIDPVSYLDMLQLEQHASIILTDSGGMQKEAFWLGVPCITMRDETEWVETVESGWNKVTGADRHSILEAVSTVFSDRPKPAGDRLLYCISNAANRIIQQLICE